MRKFTSLVAKGKEWLAIRLGIAISQRRQYLIYCREHYDKTLRETQPNANVAEIVLSQQAARKIAKEERSILSKPTSTLTMTQASTLLLTRNETTEKEFE